MGNYRCTFCNFIYDEKYGEKNFSRLSQGWKCPVCKSAKNIFFEIGDTGKKDAKEPRNVSDVIIAQMAEWGIKYIFGIPGTSSLGLVEAIRKNGRIKFIQVRHEETAAFMASAYGKLTGHLAACLSIAGPGATNLATGLYDAKLDHSPVLALSGMVERQMMGPGSFQEIDQNAYFEPICVFNKAIISENQAARLTMLAMKHSLLKKGVSHLSVPNDIQKTNCNCEIFPMRGMLPNTNIRIVDRLIKEAAGVIDRAKRPVIIAGFGAAGQGDKLVALARKIKAPVVSTFRAKGIIDETDELYAGSHGGIGSTAATRAVKHSDLLIVIGCSFSDMTHLPQKKIVQVDIDPMMLAKNFPSEVLIWGNSAEVLPWLTNRVTRKENPEYLAEIKDLKRKWEEKLLRESDPSQSPLRPQYIIKLLNDKLAYNAVISLDVGDNAWWFGRNFFMKNTQKLVMSGCLASMGAALPGALAAGLAYPKRQIICIAGDGGFAMVMEDFLTAVKYRLPIKVFMFNNGELGMIKDEQRFEKYPNWQTDLYNCNFAGYAQICGGTGIKVSAAEELEGAVDHALSTANPVIVDIDTAVKRFG